MSSATIAAISTPPGSGGIGIIRMSGADVLRHLRVIFHPLDSHCPYDSHRLYYGHIIHPRDKKILDEVLAVYMAAPKTYTREDVVEIHCHGNYLALQSILELLLNNATFVRMLLTFVSITIISLSKLIDPSKIFVASESILEL